MRILLTIILIFTVLITPASAATVTLTWNPVTAPDLAGYRVFARTYGGNFDYGNPVWEGTATTATVVINSEHAGFVARAYDLGGQESPDSNQASTWDGPPPAPGGCAVTSVQP